MPKQVAPGSSPKIWWILITVGLAVVALIVVGSVILARKPVLGFYDVPITVRQAIVALSEQPPFGGDFETRVLDPSRPLSAQLGEGPEPSIVFTWEGEAARTLGSRAAVVPMTTRELMASSIQSSGMLGEKAFAVPLLLDHFELAYNRRLTQPFGQGNSVSLSSLDSIARSIKPLVRFPILCAGADDSDLFLLLGALTESMGGEAAWDEVVVGLRSQQPLDQLVRTTPLGQSLQLLVRWRMDGVLHPQWFSMTGADLAATMEGQKTGFVFMTLSRHRSLSSKALEDVESVPVPPLEKARQRSFSVPVIEGILLGGDFPNSRAQAFLAALAQDEGQRGLTLKTGLAPVNSTSQAQDRQASDVRLWAAASTKLLPDFARETLVSPQQREKLAQEIRTYLGLNGAGY